MIELLQITNDPDLARLCDGLPGFRLFVDLERDGKAERQAGRNTFISAHTMGDVGRVRAVLKHSKLMVRLNPMGDRSALEIEQAIDLGADRLMLPMFKTAAELQRFCGLVNGRVPVTALLECKEALACMDEWVALGGFDELFLGLNDLHLSLGHTFMYQALADGVVDAVAASAHRAAKRFGFGGIARMTEGDLPGRLVLAEHLRLGSQAVIVSRTFHRMAVGSASLATFEAEIAELRDAETLLRRRTVQQCDQDHESARAGIRAIVKRIGEGSGVGGVVGGIGAELSASTGACPTAHPTAEPGRRGV